MRRFRKNDLYHLSLLAVTGLINSTNNFNESSNILLPSSSASNDLNFQNNFNLRLTNDLFISNNDTIINDLTYTTDDSKYFSYSSASLPTNIFNNEHNNTNHLNFIHSYYNSSSDSESYNQ